jgi:hypothetical protein
VAEPPTTLVVMLFPLDQNDSFIKEELKSANTYVLVYADCDDCHGRQFRFELRLPDFYRCTMQHADRESDGPAGNTGFV